MTSGRVPGLAAVRGGDWLSAGFRSDADRQRRFNHDVRTDTGGAY